MNQRLSARTSTQATVDPRALRGIPASIYVLRNSALKPGLLHIGVSRRGGWAKALELNRDKHQLIPGQYECIFEVRAQDSGTTLEMIHSILHHSRQGSGVLDFFEIDEASAEHIIQRCVDEADRGFRQSFAHAIENRAFRHLMDDEKQPTDQAGSRPSPEPHIREGIFKKAWQWLS